jgi:outer membrane protein assembly factor BamD
MTRELRKISAGTCRNPVAARSRLGRPLRLAAGLFVLATPLSGCGTGALWDKFLAKDDTFVEEPADKLYNEGLYLMNQRKDPKAASKKFEEVDRQHPYSDWARKSLLMSAYAFYDAGDYDSCIGAATRYVTLHPGSPALRSDSGHYPRSGPDREGHRRAGRGDPQISDVGICRQRQGQARRRARSARWP